MGKGERHAVARDRTGKELFTRFPGHKALEVFNIDHTVSGREPDRALGHLGTWALGHLGTSVFLPEAKNVVLLGHP